MRAAVGKLRRIKLAIPVMVNYTELNSFQNAFEILLH